MPEPRLGRLVAGLALVGALSAACAGIPHSGPIRLGHVPPAANGGGSDGVQVVPANPQNGATPAEVVSGFLNALGDSASDYSVAREFLADGTKWDTGGEMTTYDGPPQVTRAGPRVVTMTATRVGVISPRGFYRVAPGVIHRQFRLTRTGGQWRIDRLASGILLSTDEAVRSLQPVSIYFLNRTQDRLVPEPLLVFPQRPGLATTLIDELIAGPSPLLAPGVTTAVPQGTVLSGTVPVDGNGLAEVNLSGQARDVGAGQLARLSAQIVWTLRQVSSVTRVRLLAGNAALTSAETPAVQPVDSWHQFDPDGPAAIGGALFTNQGHTGGLGTVVPDAFTHRLVSLPARSADGTKVAALDGGATQLLTGDVTGPLRRRFTAAQLSAPTFDSADNVYVGATTSLGSRLLEVPSSGRIRTVAGAPSGKPIDAVAVSRDGSRVALVIGRPGHAALVVGTLSSPPGHPSLHGLVTLLPANHAVSGVAWASANQIVTTERSGPGHRSVVELSADGYQIADITTAGAPPAPSQVAAAPGERILVSGAGGIWALTGSSWVRRATGGDPSYAG